MDPNGVVLLISIIAIVRMVYRLTMPYEVRVVSQEEDYNGKKEG